MDKNIKISAKYIGRYSSSQNESEDSHILVSEQEEPRKILIKKIYQESDFEKDRNVAKQYEEEKEAPRIKYKQEIHDNNDPASIQNRYDIQKTHLQAQMQNYKDAYLFQSQYLSGITEKSDEESGYTNQIYKSSSYVNNEGRKQDAFASSNSSATSSNINSRLLKYFEDSLQKEIPVAMSPSQALQVFNESNQMKEGSKSHSNLFPVEEEDRRISTDDIISKEEKDGDVSNYSLTKSNNYEDLTSNNTSSKKNNYKNFFNPNKLESESENDQKRIQFDQIESKSGSMNSSMERKERNAKKFIEINENNILNELSDHEQNLNISSISRLEESAISNKAPASEDEKSMSDENKEKIISRQPTFSRFIPNLREEKEIHRSASGRQKHENKSEDRSDKNLKISDGVIAPLLSSISGSEQNLKELSKIENGKYDLLSTENRSRHNHMKPDISHKSTENAYPQFFISNEIKTFTMSSEGSKKYRSPTFEAISEEENNMSNY